MKRQATNASKEGAALASIAVSSLMTLAKFAAGFLSGSLAVLSEAGHNLADIGVTLLTYFAIKIAHKPADEEHHYGHAKVEALAALIETGFLLRSRPSSWSRRSAGSAAIRKNRGQPADFRHSDRLHRGRFGPLERNSRAIAAKTKSDALAADALHFSSDMIASCWPSPALSPRVSAFRRATLWRPSASPLLSRWRDIRIGRRTIDTLIDAAPKGTRRRGRTRSPPPSPASSRWRRCGCGPPVRR